MKLGPNDIWDEEVRLFNRNEQRTYGYGELDFMRGPIVYGWFRGEACQYIGMSLCGMERPLDVGHHRLKDMGLSTEDRLRVWRLSGCWCASYDDMHARPDCGSRESCERLAKMRLARIEGLLINLYKPVHNKVGGIR